MNEIIRSTALTFSKRDICKQGIRNLIETVLMHLMRGSEDAFADHISEDLKDFDNNYQFILTIKELENPNE